MKHITKWLTLLTVLLIIGITVKAALGLVVINEVMYKPTGASTEWIEVYNNGQNSIDLSKWEVYEDGKDRTITFISGNSPVVASGELVVVAQDAAQFSLDYPKYTGKLFESKWVGLNNDGDILNLKDENDAFAGTELHYLSSWGANGNGYTLVKIDPSKDDNTQANWKQSTVISGTPGQDNQNDAPVAFDIETSTVEDTNTSVQLLYTDADGNDFAENCTITNVANGKVSKDCSCQKGVCTVEFAPADNFYGDLTAQYTVNDGEANSNLGVITIHVTPINDKPLIGELTAQTAVQGVKFEYAIPASDVDESADTPQELSASSNMAWLNSNKLILTGTPAAKDIADNQEVKVIVADKSGAQSEAKTFNLTVKPALEITSLQVKVNGISADVEKEIDVHLGDKVNVELIVANNFDKDFGKVTVSGNLAQWENLYSLPAGKSSAVIEELTVPEFFWNADKMDITVKATYDNFWSFLPGIEDFTDEQILTFNVVKNPTQIKIVGADLEDNSFTCARVGKLDLNILNIGEQDLTPTLLVYNKQPYDNSLTQGEFTQFVGGQPEVDLAVPLTKIPNSDITNSKISLNLSALPSGEGKLYLYLVSPYLTNGFISTEALNISAGACLNKTAIEEALTFSKDDVAGVTLNLFSKDNDGNYKYIVENENYENQLTFTLKEQSNKDLIDCAIPNGVDLMCGVPAAGESGSSTLDVEIKQKSTNADISTVTEKVSAVVKNDLAITKVKINGVEVQEKGTAPVINPLQPVNFAVDVTNYLDYTLTEVQVMLMAEGDEFAFSEPTINLASGAKATLTFSEVMPYAAVQGEYKVQMLAQGKDYKNNAVEQTDVFEFTIPIEQNDADVAIIKADMSQDTVACTPETTLTVNLANAGLNDESDVKIEVSSGKISFTEDKISISKNGGTYTKDFAIPTEQLESGKNTFQIQVSYRNGLEKTSKTVDLIKKSCLATVEPESEESDVWIVQEGEIKDFKVNLSEESELDFNKLIHWYVNDELVSSGKSEYTFTGTELGESFVTAKVNGESFTWDIYVTDIPITTEFDLAEDYFADKDTDNVENFVLENQYGKIEFTQPLDLSNLFDIDLAVQLTENMVGIDTEFAPELNVPATITLKKTFNNHAILRSDEFMDEEAEFKACPSSICKAISNGNGEFVFSVTQFSTYEVVEDVAAGVKVSAIDFSGVERGATVSTTIDITNIGNLESVNGLSVLLSIPSKYNAKMGTVPATIGAGESVKVSLQLTVPKDESAGKHSIGTLKVSSNQGTVSENIYLNPKSYLTIGDLEINEETSGELSLEETNDLAVTVKNDYTEDMEDVSVTFTLKDVDSDDLEEESDEDNIDLGDDSTFETTLDLSGENVDENEYTLEVSATGKAADGSKHQTVETFTVGIDREKHQLIISSAELSTPTVQCLDNVQLDAIVKNIGENTEDEVDVKVKSTTLNLDLVQEGFKLKKYNGEEDLTFNLGLQQATSGNHNIDVEVYRNGNLEDSESVNLEVKSCAYTSTQNQPTYSEEELTKQLQQQLQQQLAAKKALEQQNKVITPAEPTGFRESDTYTLMLWVLVLLVFIAIVFALAILVKRKK